MSGHRFRPVSAVLSLECYNLVLEVLKVGCHNVYRLGNVAYASWLPAVDLGVVQFLADGLVIQNLADQTFFSSVACAPRLFAFFVGRDGCP